MASNTITYILYICIFLLLYIIYVDKRCNCHTNIKSKLIFSLLFILLVILILYISGMIFFEYNEIEIHMIIILILFTIFALYVQDLNNNNCTCLTETLVFRPLFLSIKTLSFYIIIILVILIIILSLNKENYNYENVNIMTVDISKYINNTLKSIEKNLLQFLFHKIR